MPRRNRTRRASHQAPPTDTLIVRAVDRLLSADEWVAVSPIAEEVGVSPRHLHRRFVADVGVSPKRLERLARFARAWRQAVMGAPITWADLAPANGYADQAHLVREFRTFGARPPAHLFTAEWYGTTNVTREEGSSDDVRSVPALSEWPGGMPALERPTTDFYARVIHLLSSGASHITHHSWAAAR